MAKVQFGVGQVYFVDINQDTGNFDEGTKTETVALDNSLNDKYIQSTRVLTIPSTSTIELGEVFFYLEDQNKFSFGKLTSATTILLDEEADDGILEDYNGNIVIRRGISAGLFRDVSITTNATPVLYKGQNKFDREVAFTDIDGKVTVGEMILNEEALVYLNGMNTATVESGVGISVMDNQYGESITPLDVGVLVVKKRTGELDKYEEVYCHRVKTSSLSLPFSRNNYVTQDYEFDVQTHSSGNLSIIDYTYEV